MKLKRRETVLIGVLVVVAGYQGIRLWTGAFGDGTLNLAAIRKSAARQAAEGLSTGSVSQLALASLDALAGSAEVGRDPFRFDAPRPVAQAPRAVPLAGPSDSVVRLAAGTSAAAAARPPSIDLSYLGSFGRSDRQIAVFSDGEAIINALVGDTVQEAFIVQDIGYETVDVGFVDFPDHPPQRLTIGD